MDKEVFAYGKMRKITDEYHNFVILDGEHLLLKATLDYLIRLDHERIGNISRKLLNRPTEDETPTR